MWLFWFSAIFDTAKYWENAPEESKSLKEPYHNKIVGLLHNTGGKLGTNYVFQSFLFSAVLKDSGLCCVCTKLSNGQMFKKSAKNIGIWI